MRLWAVAASAAAMAACEFASHDSGQGAYSLFTADFVEAYTDGAARVTWVETDAGDTLRLASTMAPSWADKPDTAYRAVLYYDWAESATVAPHSLARITTLTPSVSLQPDTLPGDPIRLESVWMSATGKYLNMGFYLMVGSTNDSQAHHSVGMAMRAIDTLPDGRRQAHMRFLHSQGGVPQYYSQKYYVSIPRSLIPAHIAIVEAMTYDGMATHTISLDNSADSHPQ